MIVRLDNGAVMRYPDALYVSREPTCFVLYTSKDKSNFIAHIPLSAVVENDAHPVEILNFQLEVFE